VIRRDFDPSKNPSDCAKVMDEVTSRGEWWWNTRGPFNVGEPHFAGLNPISTTGWNGRNDYEGQGESWMEAFCKALLAMIEGRA